MDASVNVNRTSYNFKDTIRRHSRGKVKAIVAQEGYYDMSNGGKYVEGDVIEIHLNPAAILPLSQNELRYDQSGTYNQDSRKLYCYKEIPKSAKIINTMDNGTIREYTIVANQDYSEHDIGLCIYYLKRVDRNDKDD
jgi:hypothetical protein